MVERFIYSADAENSFYSKLDGIHDSYVYHLLLSGVGEKGQDLESIKMTKNPTVTKKYCERVVGGLVNLKPQIILKLEEDKLTKLECIFTHINDKKALNHLFMIQNVMDWPELGKYSCQIWYLGETNLFQVREYLNK